MNMDLYKNNQKIIGSVIKLNRINQKMSQKELAKGICVPSYLSRIENGELLPSDDVINIIFDKLGLKFYGSDDFIIEGTKLINDFFDCLNNNEFDYTNKLFETIENIKDKFLTSPLIIDYYIAVLARFCSTPNREDFEFAKTLLETSSDLLSPKQKGLFNFYLGVDEINVSGNITLGKQYILNSMDYKETGHCYFWLSSIYRSENNPIKAYDTIKKAFTFYVADGNIISLMASYEKTAEVYFMLDNYIDSIQYLEMAQNMATKLNNKYFVEHINSILAWVHYRLEDFDTSLDYLSKNSNLLDHRRIIPDSVVECLIYFSLDNKDKLLASMQKLNTLESLEHIGEDLSNILYKFFEFTINEDNCLNSHIYEGLLIYILDDCTKLLELKKVFTKLLKEYYIHNRRYKDALYL